MQYKRDGNNYVVKLERGDDVMGQLGTLFTKEGISSGSVLWAVGMIENLEIGYFNGKEYEKQTYKGPLEVVSFHGSIAMNDPRLHIHVSVAGKDHSAHGGHLFGGAANPLLELHVARLDGVKMERSYNEKSTLKELQIS